jgi:hypothetical protein
LPWFFFNVDVAKIGMDTGIINSLQQDRFNWISNVPIGIIKSLRLENKMDYMRSILRNSLTNIKVNNDKDLISTSEAIEKNFIEAFKRQDEEIASLEKQVKEITQVDMPITTIGSIVGFIPVIGIPVSVVMTARDLIKSTAQSVKLKAQLSEKRTDVINILLKSKEGDDGL